jgi:hypothetical protein
MFFDKLVVINLSHSGHEEWHSTSWNQLKQVETIWNRLKPVETGWNWLKPVETGWNRRKFSGKADQCYKEFVIAISYLAIVFFLCYD